MLRSLVFALAVGFFAAPALAQLTITAEQFRQQTGQSFDEWYSGNGNGPMPADLSALEAIVRSAGEDARFDFAGITPELPFFSRNTYVPLPSDDPDLPGYAAFFDGVATDVWKVSSETTPDVYIYRRITDDSLSWVGNGVWQDTNNDGEADPVVSRFSPHKLQAPLPLTLGQAWQTDITHLSVVNTPVGVVEVPGTREEHDIAVDGYGTLVTHHGTYDCLRVRINQTIYRPDGSVEEIGGWSYLTASFVQLGVFYNRLVPADPSAIDFDVQQPAFITYFGPAEGETGTSVAEVSRPSGVHLEANYPNPFQLATSLPFAIDTPGPVRLEVYDVRGRLVETVLDATLAAGRHAPTWSASGWPAGVYFVRLSHGGVRHHRPLLLAK